MDYKFYRCPYDYDISCKHLPGKRCEECPIRNSPARLTDSELAKIITKSIMEKHDRDLMRGDE